MKVNFHSAGALDKICSHQVLYKTNKYHTLTTRLQRHAMLVTLPETILKTSSKPVYFQRDQNPAYLRIKPLIPMPPTPPISDI